MLIPHKSVSLSLTIWWLSVLHTCQWRPVRVKHLGEIRREKRRNNKLKDIEAYATKILSWTGEVLYSLSSAKFLPLCNRVCGMLPQTLRDHSILRDAILPKAIWQINNDRKIK